MTKTEFFLLWVISIGIYFLTFQINLILTVIMTCLLILGYIYYKGNYIVSINKKIEDGELKYYEFLTKINKVELYALPAIYIILNIFLLFKIVELNADLILLNLLFLFVPCISMFILKYKNPGLNNGLLIGKKMYQNGLTGPKIKKIDVNINVGKTKSELIFENIKTGKKDTYEFQKPELILTEIKNVA